jgi:glycosyltransferase involved in cell wall biosynthesis
MIPDKKRLKVLFLPIWYPSEINPVGGIFIKEHAKAASTYNDIIVLYVYPDSYPQRRHLHRASEDIEDGIKTIRVRYSGIPLYLWRKRTAKRQKPGGLSDSRTKATISSKLFAVPRMMVGGLIHYWSIFSAFRKLVREGWKPDIIHAHVYLAGVPAVILGKLYKIPVVITEHTTEIATHSLMTLNQKELRFAMSRAKFVLPVSDDLKETVENYYGIKSRFRVVPNVIDTKMFYPLTPQAENEEHRETRILLICNLIPQKGIPYLLEALGQIRRKERRFRLDIVGNGPNRTEYEKLTEYFGLEDVVKFHGLKPKEEVADFMRKCDFFVQPSLWETFGVVYIEAMACGKPVIGSNLPVLREIIDQRVGILVPPRDVKALKAAIEYMLDNYKNYSPEKIAQYARERFSYEVVGKMLDEVYREALSRRE